MSLSPAAVPWLIEPGGVGTLRLGQPVPAALVTDELETRYVAGYLADGVLYEGFRLEHPPLTIVLSRGPFAELERKGHDGPPSVEQMGVLAPRAMIAVREGATIRGLMIRGAGLATAAGLGVGSTLADLEATYPDLQLLAVPPTVGDDRCVATSKAHPGLRFFFGSFDGAHVGGVVTRVDLWIPER